MGLRLERLPLNEFARLVFGEVLGESFALDESVALSDRPVSLDLRGLSKDQVRAMSLLVLRGYGVGVRKVGAVNIVEKVDAKPAAQEVLTYRPRYRGAGYLQNAVRGFVTKGRFAGASSVSTGSAAVSGSVSAMGVAAPSPSQSVIGVTPGGGVSSGQIDVVVYQGEKDDVELLRGLLAELDVPAQEVLIRATVFEVQTTAADSSAVQIAADVLGGKVGVSFGDVASKGLLRIGFAHWKTALDMLSRDSRFKTVGTPTLRVTSGQSASVTVGSDVPVLGNITTAANGVTQQSVNYESAGVILNLSPVALRDVVTVQIKQQVSTFAVTNTGVNSSPTKNKREFSSYVSMRAGEAVFMGGMDQTTENEAGAGLRFLPPFLWSKSKDDSRVQLLLVLEVELVTDEAERPS